MLHFMLGATTSVNSSNEIRWEWATSSTQTYGTQLTAAISTWNALGTVDIISTSTGRTLITQETNDPLYDWSGSYSYADRPPLMEINTGKLFDNTSDEIQNTWTHELGHALGLGHSYIDNTVYYINSPQTTLGTQDILDYNFCWVSGMGNCTKYQ
jgi:predicted Zn-dependent protease